MSKRKLYVYIVHQEAYFSFDKEKDCMNQIGYKILGVYLDKTAAEAHRHNIVDSVNSYVSVTKHAVRGNTGVMVELYEFFK